MPTWRELPAEILENVFSYVKQDWRYKPSWLTQYQLTCKSWSQTARECLYGEITFDSATIIEKFIKCMQNSHSGWFTRTITFYGNEGSRFRRTPKDYESTLWSFPSQNLFELAKVCPAVDRVKGELTGRDQWLALDTITTTCWQNIKELPYPIRPDLENDDGLPYYVEIAIACRQKLTHLYWPRYSSYAAVLSPQLPTFNNLTHLAVNDVSCSVLMDYDEIIQCCPNLISLSSHCVKYDWNINIPDNYSENYDMSSIQPHNKVKKLDVTLLFHKDVLRYVIHKFPNLDTLTLRICYDIVLFTDWTLDLESYFAENGNELMKYLAKFHDYEFYAPIGSSLVENYIRFTPNVDILIRVGYITSELTLCKNAMTFKCEDTKEERESLKRIFSNYYQNINNYSLEYFGKSKDIIAWIEDSLEACKELHTFHLDADCLRLPSEAAMTAGAPLNSSVKTLSLDVQEIENGSLAAYARLLPALHNLIISHKSSQKTTKYIIEMPDTSFDHLSLKLHNCEYSCSHDKSNLMKQAILIATTKKSGKKQCFIDMTSGNGVIRKYEPFKDSPRFVIILNCQSIDYFSLSVDYDASSIIECQIRKCSLFL
ncbi:hypothetical protein BCV72DRAFT_261978 [Rhizopus microsporus var. microsporus]|uniref:Uncharacterized protein n=1 Tax=Rhizopus microsporus var. microsporus TaxID=86635 RepID=A0A1X0R6F3_RHIZD|nr:hypothetical protein BCV72DRAFT_261978 [Rhizopus microsporus var. microsporus]